MTLLQIDSQGAAVLIVATVIFLIAVAIIVGVTRWVFQIGKQIRNQEKQIALLARIAQANGVANEDIETILRH